MNVIQIIRPFPGHSLKYTILFSTGRRSRRNSFSDDSQLTIENFGGSQDQINTIGRNYERERERKTSTTSISAEPAIPLRSSIADARGTLQLGYDTDSGSEKQDRETEKNLRRQGSVDNVSQRNNNKEGDETPKRKTSFATLPSNTTTWQQQSALSNQSGSDGMHEIYTYLIGNNPLIIL